MLNRYRRSSYPNIAKQNDVKLKSPIHSVIRLPSSLRPYAFFFLNCSKCDIKPNFQWEGQNELTENSTNSESNQVEDQRKQKRKSNYLITETSLICSSYDSMYIDSKNSTKFVVSKSSYELRDFKFSYNTDDPPYIHWLSSIFNLVGQYSDYIAKGQFLWELIHPQNSHGYPQYNPTGSYCVRLYHEDRWKVVEIQDVTPCDNRKMSLTPKLKNPQEIWPILLSLALWKLFEIEITLGTDDLPFFEALTSWKSIRLGLEWDELKRYSKSQIFPTVDLFTVPYIDKWLSNEDEDNQCSKYDMQWCKFTVTGLNEKLATLKLRNGREYLLNERVQSTNVSNTLEMNETNWEEKQPPPIPLKSLDRNTVESDFDESIDSFSSYDSSHNYIILPPKLGEPFSIRNTTESDFPSEFGALSIHELSENKAKEDTCHALENPKPSENNCKTHYELEDNSTDIWISWEYLKLISATHILWIHLPPAFFSPISSLDSPVLVSNNGVAQYKTVVLTVRITAEPNHDEEKSTERIIQDNLKLAEESSKAVFQRKKVSSKHPARSNRRTHQDESQNSKINIGQYMITLPVHCIFLEIYSYSEFTSPKLASKESVSNLNGAGGIKKAQSMVYCSQDPNVEKIFSNELSKDEACYFQSQSEPNASCLFEPIHEIFPELFDLINANSFSLQRPSNLGKIKVETGSSGMVMKNLEHDTMMFMVHLQSSAFPFEAKISGLNRYQDFELGNLKIMQCFEIKKNESNFYQIDQQNFSPPKGNPVRPNITCEVQSLEEFIMDPKVFKCQKLDITFYDSKQATHLSSSRWVKAKILVNCVDSTADMEFLYLLIKISQLDLRNHLNVYLLLNSNREEFTGNENSYRGNDFYQSGLGNYIEVALESVNKIPINNFLLYQKDAQLQFQLIIEYMQVESNRKCDLSLHCGLRALQNKINFSQPTSTSEVSNNTVVLTQILSENYVSIEGKSYTNSRNMIFERKLRNNSDLMIMGSLNVKLNTPDNYYYVLRLIHLKNKGSTAPPNISDNSNRPQQQSLLDQPSESYHEKIEVQITCKEFFTIPCFYLSPNQSYILEVVLENRSLTPNILETTKDYLNEDKISSTLDSSVAGIKVHCDLATKLIDLSNVSWELGISTNHQVIITDVLDRDYMVNNFVEYDLDETGSKFRESFLGEIRNSYNSYSYPSRLKLELSSDKLQLAELHKKIIWKLQISVGKFFNLLYENSPMTELDTINKDNFINSSILKDKLGLPQTVLSNLFSNIFDNGKGKTTKAHFCLAFEVLNDNQNTDNNLSKEILKVLGDNPDPLQLNMWISRYLKRPLIQSKHYNSKVLSFIDKIKFKPKVLNIKGV